MFLLIHTGKVFRNLIKSNQNKIVFTISLLVWNPTEFRQAHNRSENDVHNLIPVDQQESGVGFSVCVSSEHFEMYRVNNDTRILVQYHAYHAYPCIVSRVSRVSLYSITCITRIPVQYHAYHVYPCIVSRVSLYSYSDLPG